LSRPSARGGLRTPVEGAAAGPYKKYGKYGKYRKYEKRFFVILNGVQDL
jgi:hypothetical protein